MSDLATPEKSLELINYDWIKNIQIDLTNICNFKCKWCIDDHNKHTKRNLPYEKVIAFLDVLLNQLKVNPDMIYLSCNGESTLHPRFQDILYYIENNFKDKFLLLDTNGSFIKDEFVEYLSNIKNNKFAVFFSIWGFDESSYRKYHMVKGAFEKVKNNIKRLSKIKNPKFRLSFTSPANKKNESKKIFKFVSQVLKGENIDLKATKLTYLPFWELQDYDHLWFFVRSLVDVNLFKTKAFLRMFNKRQPIDNTLKCHYFETALSFHNSGNITNCLSDYNNSLLLNISESDITKDTMENALKSKEYLRKKELFPKEGICASCRTCLAKNITKPFAAKGTVDLNCLDWLYN